MPGQTMATQPHVMILCKPDEIVGTAITETVARRLQGIPLHFILCHQHIELNPNLLRLAEAGIVQVVLPHGDGRSNIFTVLDSIVPQWCLIGLVINTVVIEGTNGALRNLRIIWDFRMSHLLIRHQAQHEGQTAVLLTLHKFPSIMLSPDIEMPVAFEG